MCVSFLTNINKWGFPFQFSLHSYQYPPNPSIQMGCNSLLKELSQKDCASMSFLLKAFFNLIPELFECSYYAFSGQDGRIE